MAPRLAAAPPAQTVRHLATTRGLLLLLLPKPLPLRVRQQRHRARLTQAPMASGVGGWTPEDVDRWLAKRPAPKGSAPDSTPPGTPSRSGVRWRRRSASCNAPLGVARRH